MSAQAAASTARERGPITAITASPAVTSVTVAARSPARRRSRVSSRRRVAAGVTIRRAVSDRRVTVTSASIPPRSLSIWVVDDAARRDVRLGPAGELQERERVAPLDPELAEARHVVGLDPFAHGHVLGAAVVPPRGPVPVVIVLGPLAVRGEPVGALPADELAHHRTALEELPVNRRAAHAPCGRLLAEREMVGVEETERLGGPLAQVATVPLERLHAGDVHVHQVEGHLAALHPLGEREARTAGRLDADRVEARRRPDVGGARTGAEVIGVVGREALGAVEERVDARLSEHRHPGDGALEDRLEVVEILGKLVELEVLGDRAPGFGHRFEGAEQHLASVLLVVRALVGNAQDG